MDLSACTLKELELMIERHREWRVVLPARLLNAVIEEIRRRTR